jgi:cellulose synthase/poly-beta-1,6-N-acetylglucosamine synthase-like glycosyltransferase
MDSYFSVMGWGIFAVWCVLLVPSTIALGSRTLSRLNAKLPQLEQWPAVSVVVAARDEGHTIEAGMRSVLASNYPNLEVIAVNDRSQDDTGDVLRLLATDDPRLRVLNVTTLPERWLGKNHALSLGATHATGEVLLFTDADVVFQPDAIRLATAYLQQSGTDHLCLMPHLVSGGYFENALTAFFGLAFTAGIQPWLVRSRFPYSYVGVGAFNMVRRKVYDAVGGHDPLRLDVLDDVKLGKLIKSSGYRQDILLPDGLIAVRWQHSTWGVVRGLEKNAFASLDYSLVKLVIVTVMLLTLLIVPYAMVIAMPDARSLGFTATLVLLNGLFALLGQVTGASWTVFPMLPWAGLMLLFAFWRSAIITLRQQGVYWRDTFYPLSLLRENRYD